MCSSDCALLRWFVAKFMGDGALVYFGYPEAHEDDAERAVRAALELIMAVAALKTLAPLQTRVGIATGLVVVGDLIGSDDGQERGIVGETRTRGAPAKLGRAEHGGHCGEYAEAARQALRSRGPWSKRAQGHPGAGPGLGGSAGKYGGEPVRGPACRRDVARRARRRVRGPQASLAVSKSRAGRVVVLAAEAGIGKSRLVVAFADLLRSEPHTKLQYFCSSTVNTVRYSR